MTYDSTTYRVTETDGIARTALITGIAGIALSIIGLFTNQQQFFFSYLTAFVFWWTLSMGGLFFTMLHHLTNSTWSIVLRRISETIMMTIPVMAVFVIPLFFGMNSLYHWSVPDIMAEDHLLQQKAPFLNDTFFIIRTIVYFAVWILFGSALYRVSIRQDGGHTEQILKRMRKLSAPGMILFAITISFASFDWLMSLDAHWYSTIFGVYVFAGSLLSFLAFILLIGKHLNNRGVLAGTVTTEHYHDIGRLLFAFTIFWAYIAFSQYFLIWYANIPEETVWFLDRWEGSWKFFSLTIVFGYFILPFISLMTRWTKRNHMLLIAISGWLLIMHWADIYWLVMPALHHETAHLSWLDLTTFAGIGGIYIYFFFKKLASQPLVPVGDPRLQASIEFTNE
ncbi:hypothetical protein ACFL6I_03940 [candidate division KSB1 bacterium]